MKRHYFIAKKEKIKIDDEIIEDFKYDENGNLIPVYGIIEDATIYLQFSRKPDWAGVLWWEGWENLDVDDEGYAETA